MAKKLPAFQLATDVVCPPGWTVMQVADLFDQVPLDRRYDQKSCMDSGLVPVLDQSANGVIGFHNNTPSVVASPEEPVITFANHTCAMRFVRYPFSVIQNVFPLKGRTGVADTRFLFYALNGRIRTGEYKGHFPDLRRLWVPLPPLAEQRTIAAILGALDDKIDLNRRMSETLEEMARALFKSWFIDFDPVRAKAERRSLSGIDATTAALFPDKIEGVRPKGWSTATLGSLVTITRGRGYMSEQLQASATALVTLKSICRGGGYRPDGLKPFAGHFSPEQVLQEGEIVVANTDVTQAAEVIGRPAMIERDDAFLTLVASQDLSILRPLSGLMDNCFLYCLLRSDAYVHHVLSHTNGSTVLHLGREGVPSFQFVLPPSGLMLRFREIAEPMFLKVRQNNRESRVLGALGDILTPRLVSGDLQRSAWARRVGGAADE